MSTDYDVSCMKVCIILKQISIIVWKLWKIIVTLRRNKNTNVMCRVTVEVNQDVLRDMRPDLDSMTAIRLWAQKIIDLHIQQMEIEDDETMSIEEAREMTLAAVREEYAKA